MQITTRYQGPTSDGKGSRITARVTGGGAMHGRRATFPYDFAARDPHEVAARQLADRFGWGALSYSGTTTTGTVFDVALPAGYRVEIVGVPGHEWHALMHGRQFIASAATADQAERFAFERVAR